MEFFPVRVRVPLAASLRVHLVLLSTIVDRPLIDVDFEVARDAPVLEENELERLRVHLFNFSLNRNGAVPVPSATAVLDRHLKPPLGVAHRLSRRLALDNAHSDTCG